jgi:hypothetical protein
MCKISGFHSGDYEEWSLQALSSSETSVLTRATWRNIPEDAILNILDVFLASIQADLEKKF